MERIKLRGHHVDTLKFHLRYGNLLERNLTNLFEILVYGPKFFKTYHKTLKQLTPDSEIKIVEGTDDVCKVCLYYVSCSNKNYEETWNKIKRKMGLLRVIFNVPSNPDPDKFDKECLEKYKLQVGKRYSLSDIIRR